MVFSRSCCCSASRAYCGGLVLSLVLTLASGVCIAFAFASDPLLRKSQINRKVPVYLYLIIPGSIIRATKPYGLRHQTE